MTLSVPQISLRVTNHGADRGIIVGRASSGKSTLANQLVNDFATRYVIDKKKPGRILVVDTKPRWRATQGVTGNNLRRHYRFFVKGDKIPRSVLLRNSSEWNMAWTPDLTTRIVIAQRDDLDTEQLIAWQVELIKKFYQTQKAGEPSLLYVDEGMDFFGVNGSSRYGTAIQRCYRAGREKDLSTLIGVQRPKCINLQCLTEANVLYLFAINYEDDVRRLYEMGWPKGEMPPRENFKFKLLRNGKKYPKTLQLRMAA